MFTKMPQEVNSPLKNKLIYGFGVNDANYMVRPVINNKREICPYYSVWYAMIKRCYDKKYHTKRPTYKICTINNEWSLFSKFREWMERQDWKGKHLDKDILTQGNKEYSSSNCLFVTGAINNLLITNKKIRGNYPLGVSFNYHANKYSSSCYNGAGKKKHLGYFDSADDAYDAYKEFKYNLISAIANKQSNPLRSALLKYKIIDDSGFQSK